MNPLRKIETANNLPVVVWSWLDKYQLFPDFEGEDLEREFMKYTRKVIGQLEQSGKEADLKHIEYIKQFLNE